MCFMQSILILVLLSYISMRSEVKEGMSSPSPNQIKNREESKDDF